VTIVTNADGETSTTPPAPAAVVTSLRDHRDAVVELANALVGFDTQNPPGDTRGIVAWVESFLADHDVDTERIVSDPRKPNLVATVPGASDRTLLLVGHLDTVPFDAAEWTRDPLGERDGDRIYGRGATDMKGAVASMLAAARAFVESGTEPPVTLQFAFVADEETGGGAGLGALLDAGLLDADACVIGEPTGEPSRPSVAVADRGSIWLTMAAEGRAAHGSRPMLGENAIDRLYEGVRTLRERFGSRPLEVDEAVAPIVEESVEYYAPTLGEEAARDLFSRPTINLGTIEGGEAINTVPASASAEVDVRLAPGVDTGDVLSAIRACADDCAGVSLHDVSWSVGTYESVDEPVVEAVSAAAESVTGERVYRRSATGGGDAKKLRRAGIPTVEFALSTDTAHAVDEYTTLDVLADDARIYAELPYAFAERLA